MKETTPHAPIVSAYYLLSRMLQAAQRTSDIGRVFVVGGVRKLVAREIDGRRQAAHAASAIGDGVQGAEQLVADALGNDGVIDPAEAAGIRAALRKPQRDARSLASELAVPEVVSCCLPIPRKSSARP